MSDEKTQNLTDGRSFEERIFARFDALDARLDNVEERLQALEQKSYETKPIWERALAEILALGEKVEHIERKFDVLATDMLTLRARQSRIEDRMDRLESSRAQ